jgi:hypothetical protein
MYHLSFFVEMGSGLHSFLKKGIGVTFHRSMAGAEYQRHPIIRKLINVGINVLFCALYYPGIDNKQKDKKRQY